jgi:putative acetyltransferase
MPMIRIRPETTSDREAIYEVTRRAFRGMPFTDGDEPDLIDNLREAGLLVLSLVAEDGDTVVGQITFSPATISSGTGPWYALGPVSVEPERQGEGIGSRLVNEGLNAISARNALGCILTGNPLYYRRFGFELRPKNCPLKEQKEHFMVRLLADVEPEGSFVFHSLFYGDA